MNIICILAGGVGNRFGSPIPKQYHLLKGKPVIDYVIEAAKKSIADEIIVISDNERVTDIAEKYGVISIPGGKERNNSIVRGIEYISERFSCEKIIFVDAVCPLVTKDIFNLYFDKLNEYDAVFTAEKITSNLSRYDREPVNRDDYILIESPDAYRFGMIKNDFEEDSVYTNPIHMIGKQTKVYYYYGFEDYVKIVYPRDIDIAEALLNRKEKKLAFSAHSDELIEAFLNKLRRINSDGTRKWERQIDDEVNGLFNQWGVKSYTSNRDAYTGMVLELNTEKYGNVVLKMYPPFLIERYIKESFIFEKLRGYPQAPLLELHPDINAMLLKRVIPGDYISYDEDKDSIATMFIEMDKNKVSIDSLVNVPKEIQGIVEQTEFEYDIAKDYAYHPEMIVFLVKRQKEIYDRYFANKSRYLLHGDAYFKNALKGGEQIFVIDPVGYRDAFIFEYMPFLTYELVMHTQNQDIQQKYNELKSFFASFTDVEYFDEATFIFLVKQLVPSIYEANDGYKRADSFLEVIRNLNPQLPIWGQ